MRRGELLGARPVEDLDLRVVALLDLAPELVRLREEVVRVDREDARLRLDFAKSMSSSTLSSFWKEQASATFPGKRSTQSPITSSALIASSSVSGGS